MYKGILIIIFGIYTCCTSVDESQSYVGNSSIIKIIH